MSHTACNIGRIAIPHNFQLNQPVFVAKQTSREQLMRVVLLQTTKWRSRFLRTKLTACSTTFESFETLLPLNGLHLVWCMKVSTLCAVTKDMGSNIRRHLKTHLIGCHGGHGFDSEPRNVTRRSWSSGPTLWGSKFKMTASSKWHKATHATPGLCALAHVQPRPVCCHGVR